MNAQALTITQACLDGITEELESARQYADSCAVMNEELESALSDRDGTIASLTSKIETTEVMREQLRRLEKESEELIAAHEGHLCKQAELEVRCAPHYSIVSVI